MANDGNDFTGAVALDGAKVEVNDTTGLTIGGKSSGDTKVSAGGALEFAPTSVGGKLDATAKAATRPER